jgi:hypothetical protein
MAHPSPGCLHDEFARPITQEPSVVPLAGGKVPQYVTSQRQKGFPADGLVHMHPPNSCYPKRALQPPSSHPMANLCSGTFHAIMTSAPVGATL